MKYSIMTVNILFYAFINGIKKAWRGIRNNLFVLKNTKLV